MSDVYGTKVHETTTTTGTGTLTRAGAVAGCKAFSTLGANGTTCRYMLEDANGTSWEEGRGTIGTGTLARTTIIETHAGVGGSAITLTAGTHHIRNIAPAALTNYVETSSFFNVKSYGAKGDGTTDDRAAIQLAIDAAQASAAQSVTVYFPVGVYIINNSLVVTDATGFCIRGENGAEFNSGIVTLLHGSIIKQGPSWPNTTTGSLRFVTTSALGGASYKGGIWIEGLIFWCGTTVEAGGHGIHVVGSTNAGNSVFYMVNIAVRNGNKGVFFDDSSATGWQQVYVQNSKLELNLWGFYANATINMAVFRDSCIRQNAFNLGTTSTLNSPTGGGIRIQGSTCVHVSECDMEGNQCGIWVNATNVSIKGCYFEACIDTNIVLQACQAVTIDNNYEASSGRMLLLNSRNVSILRCNNSHGPMSLVVGKNCRDIVYGEPQFTKFDFQGNDLTLDNKGYYVWSPSIYETFPRPPRDALTFSSSFPSLTSATLAASTALGPDGDRSHIVAITATATNGQVRMDWSTPITCAVGEYIVLTARIQLPTTNTAGFVNFLVRDAVNGAGLADAWGAGVQTIDTDMITRGEWLIFQWVYLVQSGVTSYAATLDFILTTSGDKILCAGNAATRTFNPCVQPDLQYFGSTQAFQRNADAWRGAAVPSDTTLSWLIGERVVRDPPAVGQPKAWSCTVAGSPGTWVSEGTL